MSKWVRHRKSGAGNAVGVLWIWIGFERFGLVLCMHEYITSMYICIYYKQPTVKQIIELLPGPCFKIDFWRPAQDTHAKV